jgi:hypothetical protein
VLAALEQARLDLTRTTLRVVRSLQLNIGQFVATGQPALTFLRRARVRLQLPAHAQRRVQDQEWTRRLQRCPIVAGSTARPGFRPGNQLGRTKPVPV